jgi:hypothetical protein
MHSVLHTFQRFTLFTGLGQSRRSTADYALLTISLPYKWQFRHLNVVHMTAAKFKHLIFSVWGLALSNVANIFIFMILDDFCLLPALFSYVIINVRNLESHMHIADRSAPRKISEGAENLILPQIPRWGKYV